MTIRTTARAPRCVSWLTGAAAVALLAGCEPADDLPGDPGAEPGSIAEPLVGSSLTNARPEIGRFTNDTDGLECSATIVDPRFFLTAAHCMRHRSAPLTGRFRFTHGFNTIATVEIDRGYALGTKRGSTDIALVRMVSPVSAAAATPASIAPVRPASGTLATFFGFGCDARGTQSAEGTKQYREFKVGTRTKVLCEGDSGGPVVIGGVSANGPIYAVNSGFDGQGYDQVADAVANAPAMLTAVKAVGGTDSSNQFIGEFAGWAQQANVKVVTGDFNGDGNGDIALAGGSSWTTVPIAFGNGAGQFTVTNRTNAQFAHLAAQARLMVAGDFDGDGKDDLAILGGTGWTTQPVAFSLGDGTFSTTNEGIDSVGSWASTTGVQAIAGDFNGDGFADIVLTGGAGWRTLPVAFSDGEGTFTVTNFTHPTFAGFAAQGGVHAVAGDFDGNGAMDVALTGGSGWTSIPVAFSNRDGTFNVTNRPVPLFPGWSRGVKTVAGDFDGDGVADLAAAGGSGWTTVTFAFSKRDGTFVPGNLPMPAFPAWANAARFMLAGKMNRDGRHDLVLLGGSGWNTQPIAFTAP